MSASTSKPSVSREIWVLVAAAFVIAIGYGLVSPVLPEFARTFDVGVTAASFVISAFALCRLVFAPASGRLVRTLGERPVYLTGLLIVALSTGASGFAQSYWQLVVFRGLGGIGSTMFTVSAMGLLVRLAQPEVRGRVTGLYASAFLLGGIGGPVIGGALAGFGLRIPFLIYAVALLIAMAVVGTQLRNLPEHTAPGSSHRESMRLREALAHPAFRAAITSSFAEGWAGKGVRVALVPLFAVAIGAGTSVAGYALAVFAVGNAVVMLPAGRWADQHGRRGLVRVGLLVMGLGSIGLGFSTGTGWLLAASVVTGVGTGLMTAPQQAAVADVIGSQRNGGPVLAAFQMASDIGSIVGPVAAGALADHVSYNLAFAVTGAICLAALPGWIRAPETLSRRAERAGVNGSDQRRA